MHVVIDGRPVQSAYAGDRTYLENLLNGLVALPGVSKVTLYGDARLGADFSILGEPRWAEHIFTAPTGWLWTPLAVPGALRRDGADIFHATYLVPPLCRCATVVTIHDATFRLFPEFFPRGRHRLMSLLIGLSAHRARAVITLSECSRRDLIRTLRLPAEKVFVTPLAPGAAFGPGDRAAAERQVAERWGVTGPFVLTVGYSNPRKNVPRLIAAIERVGSAHAPALVIAGHAGMDDEAGLRSRWPALGERLIFTGSVSEADLVALYRAASVFAFPSLYEGFGLPVLEAMASGAPVVTSATSCLAEVAGEAALLVDPTDVSALAGAISRVLSDPALAGELSRAGPAQAARFSWERTARLTYEVYERALAGRPLPL